MIAPLSRAAASVSVTPQEMRTELVSKVKTRGLDKQKTGLFKQGKGFFKKMNNLLSFRRAADLGGINDPVDKWLWIGLIAIGISIIAYAVSVWVLGYILSIFGVVALIIWLIKKANL
jgi:hypothetical protein